MRNLVSWAMGGNFTAWHVVANWAPGLRGPGVPMTVCGIRVPDHARMSFRDAELRPAEVCAHCWPAPVAVAA